MGNQLYKKSELIKELEEAPSGKQQKTNNKQSPTERTQHLDIWFFSIQDWREDGDIVMRRISGVLNAADSLTSKPLGWVLHARHARRMMEHY